MPAESNPTPKARIFLGAISIGTIAFGVWKLIQAIKVLRQGHWIPFAILVCFACFCLLLAALVWFHQTARSVRWLFIMAALICYFYVLQLVGVIFPGAMSPTLLPPERNLTAEVEYQLVFTLPIIFMMLIYRWSIRLILPRLDLIDNRSLPQRIWSIKVVIGLLALLIFSAGSEISEVIEKTRGPRHIPADLWDGVTILGPFVISVGIYKLIVRCALRKMQTIPTK
jgi:glucan phosphoethanolaminetransferase (alkaline phosphatase superfamily)